MKKKHIRLLSTKLFFLLFLIALNSFSQEKYLKHKVVKGESFYSISKKYNINIQDIEKLNEKYRNNLKPNIELKIPNSKFKSEKVVSEKVSSEISHEVLPKETLYGIARKYGITLESLKKANPIIESSGLDVGAKIKVLNPKIKNEVAEKEIKVVLTTNQEEIKHKVLPKETKYSIAKKYGKTVLELEKLNPTIASGLPSGFELLIQNGKNRIENTESITKEVFPEVIKENEVVVIKESPIESSETNPPKEKVLILGSLLLDGLVEKSSEYIGVRYRSGGTNKEGFDCSGLMTTIFNSFDIKLPRTSADQADFGASVSSSEAKKGDLIFFATGGGKGINHVGMITDVIDGEIKFIHASVHGGVMVSSNNEVYYSSRFIKINRVVQ